MTIIVYRKGSEYWIIGDAATFAARVLGSRLRTRKGSPLVVIPQAELEYRLATLLKQPDVKIKITDW